MGLIFLNVYFSSFSEDSGNNNNNIISKYFFLFCSNILWSIVWNVMILFEFLLNLDSFFVLVVIVYMLILMVRVLLLRVLCGFKI